jgi:hypothetical protein
MLWAGWIISGIVLLFLLVDGISKVMLIPAVVEATARIGYPQDLLRPIGIIGLTCGVLYAVPRTALLGAILLTGFLGGAVASPPAPRRSAFQPCPLRGLRRNPRMGRALSAGRSAAGSPATTPRGDGMITRRKSL